MPSTRMEGLSTHPTYLVADLADGQECPHMEVSEEEDHLICSDCIQSVVMNLLDIKIDEQKQR